MKNSFCLPKVIPKELFSTRIAISRNRANDFDNAAGY